MSVSVLVVDDSKLARIVAGKALAQLQPDWQRLEASSADQALTILREHGADLVLIDFNMPGRDGLELAADIRTYWPDMPIAVVTANLQDEIVARARAINAAFVAKPVTADGLSGFLAAAAVRVRAAAR